MITTAKDIDDAIARAERANPGIEPRRVTFREQLAARLAAGAALESLHVEDLYLAGACAEGDRAAIDRLEGEHFRAMPIAMAQLRLPEAQLDEMQQRLRVRLLVRDGEHAPRIAGYSGFGPLAAWVRAVATRLVVDELRASGRELPSDEETFASLATPDAGADIDHMKRRYADAFRAALRASFASLEPERRTELKLYYLDGLTLEDLGALYRVVPSTVARRIARTREEILARTRVALGAELGIDEVEMQSILDLIASRIELSRSALG